MAKIEVRVPPLLRDCTEQQAKFWLEADTLRQALHHLLARYPLLRVHLYDEQDRLRAHVLIYYNADNIRGLSQLDIPLQPGDQLSVLQAVSGGA